MLSWFFCGSYLWNVQATEATMEMNEPIKWILIPKGIIASNSRDTGAPRNHRLKNLLKSHQQAGTDGHHEHKSTTFNCDHSPYSA